MPKATAARRTVALPFGFTDAAGETHRTAEVRPITGADEYRVGLSKEYTAQPIDAVYELLMLARCVTKLGDHAKVTLDDILQLHPDDLEVLKRAIHQLTYVAPVSVAPPKPAKPPAPVEPAAPPPGGRRRPPRGTTTTTTSSTPPRPQPAAPRRPPAAPAPAPKPAPAPAPKPAPAPAPKAAPASTERPAYQRTPAPSPGPGGKPRRRRTRVAQVIPIEDKKSED